MRASWFSMSVLVGGVAAVALVPGGNTTVAHAETAAAVGKTTKMEKKPTGNIEPKADEALKRMSEYMAGLKTFRLEATTIDEEVTTEGQKLQELQESKIAVRRPNGPPRGRSGSLQIFACGAFLPGEEAREMVSGST